MPSPARPLGGRGELTSFSYPPTPNPILTSLPTPNLFLFPQEDRISQERRSPSRERTFALYSVADPLERDVDDALFAPIEITREVGGRLEGIGVGIVQKKMNDDLLTNPRSARVGAHVEGSSVTDCSSSIRVRAFIDCGASNGIVSAAFVSLHRIRMIADSSLGSCLLGDGSARVEHVGRTELMRVRCGGVSFTYSFHILQSAAYDLILGRDIMKMCGMVVTNVPAVFPSDIDADNPRRADEQILLQSKRLTRDGVTHFSSLPSYRPALALCEAAVARNVKARVESNGAATTLPHSQLRIRHTPNTPPSYVPPYNIKHTDKIFVTDVLNFPLVAESTDNSGTLSSSYSWRSDTISISSAKAAAAA